MEELLQRQSKDSSEDSWLVKLDKILWRTYCSLYSVSALDNKEGKMTLKKK